MKKLILIIIAIGIITGVLYFINKKEVIVPAVVPPVVTDINLIEKIIVSKTGISPLDSGVEGVVTLGPTCPVMRNPPDPQCGDKPYVTTIQVISIGSPKSSPFTTVESDKEGKYKIMLPPGEYALQPAGGSVLPRCETKNIKIEASKIIKVDLSCDSGIR